MFTVQVADLSRELTDLRVAIQWQENLRQTIYAPNLKGAPINIDAAALVALTSGAPKKLAWQVFDCSAAVTRIYALYENSICNLVEEFAMHIARLYPNYRDLDDSLRIGHRVGIAQILSRWSPENSLFSKLTEEKIAAGLVDGLRGDPYSLLSDAFLTDSNNYRPDVITRMFSKLGIKAAFERSMKMPDAEELCSKILESGDTPTSYLREFIVERNEAAHGALHELSSSARLIEYVTFIEMLVGCLATLLRSEIINRGISTGAVEGVANAVKRYSNCIYGVRSLVKTEFEPGQIFFAGKGLYHYVVIEQLRILKDAHTVVVADVGTEFGMQLDRQIQEGSTLYRWK